MMIPSAVTKMTIWWMRPTAWMYRVYGQELWGLGGSCYLTQIELPLLRAEGLVGRPVDRPYDP